MIYFHTIVKIDYIIDFSSHYAICRPSDAPRSTKADSAPPNGGEIRPNVNWENSDSILFNDF